MVLSFLLAPSLLHAGHVMLHTGRKTILFDLILWCPGVLIGQSYSRRRREEGGEGGQKPGVLTTHDMIGSGAAILPPSWSNKASFESMEPGYTHGSRL